METVYLETTVVSYLVARPSADAIVAGHQQATLHWWANRKTAFECFISQVVIDEASLGDPGEAQKRLAIIRDFPPLAVTSEAQSLAIAILQSGAIPPKAIRDAAHIAVAAIHAMDYLLTWNCKHLANAQIMRRIGLTCHRAGYRMPLICTPDELMGE
jgi:hypothetical protein